MRKSDLSNVTYYTTLTKDSFTLKVKKEATAQELPVEAQISYQKPFAILRPSADLLPDTQYLVTLTGDIKDKSGRNLKAYQWEFKTGTVENKDNTPPTISTRSPAEGSTDAPINSKVIVNFNERMNPTTFNNSNVFITVGTTPTRIVGVLSVNENSFSFSPATPLAANTDYTVTVNNQITDLNGNAFLGAVWNFTVTAKLDNIAPTITSTNPVSNSKEVLNNTRFQIKVSEGLDITTLIYGSNIILNDQSSPEAVQASLYYDSSTNTLTVIPTAKLTLNNSYTLSFNGVTDTAKNLLISAPLNFSIEIDSDGDLMSDRWEKLYAGLNPSVNDAQGDLDNDGWVNQLEFNNGTNPLINEKVVITIINSLLLSD